LPSEGVLRPGHFEAYMDREGVISEYTTDSNRTRVDSDIDPDDLDTDGELGYQKVRRYEYEPKGISDPWDDTLVEKSAPAKSDAPPDSSDSDQGSPTPRACSGTETPTDLPFWHPPADAQRQQHPQQRAPSVSLPLLIHGDERDGSRGSSSTEHVDLSLADLDEFGVGAAGLAGRGSMAGIGTAARGPRWDPSLRHGLGQGSIVPFAAPDADAELGLGPTPREMTSSPRPRRMPSGPRPLGLESDSLKNQT
jgi:hypothetical protein